MNGGGNGALRGNGRSASRPVGSVERAIALLDALAGERAGLGVNELARRIGVNASTASRLLATLESRGLVERDPSGRFRLGMRIVALADDVLSRLDVRQLARPHLQALADRTGETATLSVPGGREAVTVEFVPGSSSVVSLARVGRPSVRHATAVGKVLLAFASDAAPPPAAEELVAYTPRTIVDPAALASEVRAVARRGWAEAVGEREPDLHALAVPVPGRTGELAAILGLQGPGSRLTAARRREFLPLLQAAAEALAADLGGGERAARSPAG